MKYNKLFKKLISFAMAAVLIAGGMTGFTTAKAAEIPTVEESIDSVYSASYRFSFSNVGTDGKYAIRTDLGGTSFSLGSGKTIDISYAPISGSDAIVEILNTNGSKFGEFHISTQVSGRVTYTLPAGTYQFRVHAASGTTSGGFTVTVRPSV